MGESENNRAPGSAVAAPDRRAVLAAGLGGALSLGLGAGRAAAAEALTASEIAPGVTLIAGAGANVVAARRRSG